MLYLIILIKILLILEHLVKVICQLLLIFFSHFLLQICIQWRQLESIFAHLFNGFRVLQYLGCMFSHSILVFMCLKKVSKNKSTLTNLTCWIGIIKGPGTVTGYFSMRLDFNYSLYSSFLFIYYMYSSKSSPSPGKCSYTLGPTFIVLLLLEA